MTDLKAVSQLEMFVSAVKLPNKDTFSKSDPFVVMEIQDNAHQSGTWKELGRSEVAKNNLSPEFKKVFLCDYFFEEHQQIKLTFYDSDDESKKAADNLKKHDYLGHCEFLLGDLVSAPGQTLHMPILNKKNKPAKKDCVVTVRGEETSSSKDLLKIAFRAEKLDKKDFFGKSDPL
jgi:hypothetical protein